MKGVLLVACLIKMNKQTGERGYHINHLLYSLMRMKVAFGVISQSDLVSTFKQVLESVCTICFYWKCKKINVRKI